MWGGVNGRGGGREWRGGGEGSNEQNIAEKIYLAYDYYQISSFLTTRKKPNHGTVYCTAYAIPTMGPEGCAS